VPDVDGIYAELLKERLAQAQTQQVALTTAIAEMRAARSLTFADDEHDPEGSTVSLDQARDAALLDQIDRTVAELTAAQQRLLSGTYGGCELCGRQIPSARLLARPEARRCVSCSGPQRMADHARLG
jgi:RNA polymerase-binding transcription factor DksA